MKKVLVPVHVMTRKRTVIPPLRYDVFHDIILFSIFGKRVATPTKKKNHGIEILSFQNIDLIL